MAKRPIPEPSLEVIRDEAVYIATGETRYSIDLDEQTVEELERGICSEALAQRMHDLLSWRRDAIRAQTLDAQAPAAGAVARVDHGQRKPSTRAKASSSSS